MTEGLILMMNGADDFIGPVNLGNPDECSILQVAEMIVGMTGSRSKVIFKPLPQDDPIRRCPDIRLAKERLDWEPGVELEEGIKRTIEYFRGIV